MLPPVSFERTARATPPIQDDAITVAAIAVAAACVVTTDHEAVGHGGACLGLADTSRR
jgi:hypothetical protein